MSEPQIKTVPVEADTARASLEANFEKSIAVVERRGIDRLFLDYFGVLEQPFGVTPDLRFLYLGAKHRQALDVLNYGTELNRGFLALIAHPGMGKTSLLFHYLESLRHKARTAFLFHTDCNSTELMRYLLADLGLDGKHMDLAEMRALLGRFLMDEMEAGRRFVLVVDEAQNLDEKVLESIRLLSNFETPWMKLMHIVLAGQPQLADRLARPSMAQLRQRISLTIRIEPFTREEVGLYIDHRLRVAGYKGTALFTVGARGLLAERSEGIPRNINNLCFCAMSYAWGMKRKAIDRDTMSEVLRDLDPGSPVVEEVAAPRLPEEPKPAVLQTSYSVDLTRKTPPDGDLPSKIVLTALLLVALAWFGVQRDVGEWIGSTLHAFSNAVSHFVDPVPAAAPPEAASPAAGADEASTGPKPSGPANNQRPRAPQPTRADASSIGGKD